MTTEGKGTVTLINTGNQTFRTGGGAFEPKGKVKVTAEEAKRLLRYPGIVDAAEYREPAEGDAESADLKKQNEQLTAENNDLRKQLAEARGGKGGTEDAGTTTEDTKGKEGVSGTKIKASGNK